MFKVNEKEDTVLVHFEQISHIVVLLPLLTLNK